MTKPRDVKIRRHLPPVKPDFITWREDAQGPVNMAGTRYIYGNEVLVTHVAVEPTRPGGDLVVVYKGYIQP